jgi:uncharacterized membrane protein
METIFTLAQGAMTMHVIDTSAITDTLVCHAHRDSISIQKTVCQLPATQEVNVMPTKSIKERAFHALLFEIIGVILFAPLLAWAMGHSLAKMGAMTVMVSTVAMLWNMLFNAMFDSLRRKWGFNLSLGTRVLHALGFEGGLILVVVPLAAWWLSISLMEAFLLDIGLLLLFLPYTLVFNWVYDKLRERVIQRRQISRRGFSSGRQSGNP